LTRVDFSVPIQDDLDFDNLSGVFPDVSFETPSPDILLSLYRLVISQAFDLEGDLLDLKESRT